MDLSSLGPSAAAVIMAIVFLKYIQSKDESQQKRDELFAKSLEKNTQAMAEVAVATKKSAKEAEQRNGHLAELALENQRENQKHQTAVLDAIKHITNQHVDNQVVNNQQIKE